MTIKLKPWHLLDHVKTPEEIALYLEACLEEADEDSEFITNAVYEIAKAKHLTSVTPDVEREKSSFKEMFGLIKALGLQLKIIPVGYSAPRNQLSD